jgi:hypothetical protein
MGPFVARGGRSSRCRRTPGGRAPRRHGRPDNECPVRTTDEWRDGTVTREEYVPVPRVVGDTTEGGILPFERRQNLRNRGETRLTPGQRPHGPPTAIFSGWPRSTRPPAKAGPKSPEKRLTSGQRPRGPSRPSPSRSRASRSRGVRRGPPRGGCPPRGPPAPRRRAGGRGRPRRRTSRRRSSRP